MITAPKIHTDLLWDLSFLFIGLAVVYFIFVFFYRNRLLAKSKSVKQRKRELSPMISEFLFHEEEASKDEKSNYVNLKIEIRQLLKDDFNRKVLSEILLDLRKDVSGETQNRLFKIYQDLGLHNDEFGRLKSWRWQIVSKAILNLTQMQVAEAYSFVTKFINDKRHTIRKQAEIAIVTLKPEGINYFLDTTKFKISEWQQLKLMDVLRNEDDYQPPRFKAWLTSTNRHVVLFALRLMKFYDQNDADSSLIELVKHKNSQIKEAAIGCIKEFNIVKALPTLKLVFWKSSTDIKISILDVIGALGNESDIEFLQLIEKKEANFSVRSKAHSSINAISPDSIIPSKGVVNSSKYTIPADIKIEIEEEDEIDTEGLLKTSDFEILDDIEIEQELEFELELEEETTADLYSPNVIPNETTEQPEDIIDAEEQELEEKINIEQNSPNVISEETIEQPEEIIDNEVKIYVMEENQKSEQKETTEPIVNEANYEENETLSFDFLPLVVQQVVKDEVNDSEEDSSIELNDIAVHFEEVSPKEVVKSLKKKTPSVEIKEEEIAFLPLVTDVKEESPLENDIEEQPTTIIPINEIEVRFESIIPIDKIEVSFEEVQHTTPNQDIELPSDYSEYKTFEILDAHVIYDEITISSAETIESENKSESDPYFLSLPLESPLEGTMDVKSNVNPQTLQSYDMEPQDEQKLKKIIKDLIDFNERKQSEEPTKEYQDSPLLEFGDEFVDTSKVSETNQEIVEEPETELQREVEEEVQDKPNVVKLTIPKAILSDDIIDDIVLYKENTEESRMLLLDDIAEMGDQREIPLLKELLVNEKYKTVKDRVKSLIDKFSDTKDRPEPDTLLKPFNVFEDLFRTCDTEAKLILMDEIVAVGDEGEIGFLEGLLEDKEKEISNKAARILEELRLKLSASDVAKTTKTTSIGADNASDSRIEVLMEQETLAEYDSLLEELQIASPQTSEIFDLTFELTEPFSIANKNSIKENNPSEKSGNQESILGQICAFSNKIIDKLNG